MMLGALALLGLTAAGCGNVGILNPAFLSAFVGGVVPFTPGPGAAYVFVRCVNDTDEPIEFIVTIQRNVLVLDEVAVFVDDAGIERLMRLVAEKLDRVETCFLVSQNPEFKGFADTTWTVVKEEGVSRLEVA